MGERTPHLDGSARGALVGLTASHTRGHVVRAILEGVAFSLRDTFTLFQEMSVPFERIRLGGGGARSPLWRRSEEHTSELQSQSNLVCRLLLEKKNSSIRGRSVLHC